MKRDTKLYVKDILDAMLAIEKFVEGMDFMELPGLKTKIEKVLTELESE